jgi:hypothetical protein
MQWLYGVKDIQRSARNHPAEEYAQGWDPYTALVRPEEYSWALVQVISAYS